MEQKSAAKTANMDFSRIKKVIPNSANRVQSVTKVKAESFEFISILLSVNFSQLFTFLWIFNATAMLNSWNGYIHIYFLLDLLYVFCVLRKKTWIFMGKLF